MAKKAKAAPEGAAAEEGKKSGGRKKLVLILLPVLLLGGVGGGLWFTGILPRMLGMGHAEGGHEAAGQGPAHAAAAHTGAGGHAEAGHGEAKHEKKGEGKEGKAEARGGTGFVELPEIIANLNVSGRRTSFVKVKARLELARPEDEAALRAVLPRVQDLFTTYLREMRPEELRGSAGTYRLREELIARASIAAAPARVADVLFTEIIVQ